MGESPNTNIPENISNVPISNKSDNLVKSVRGILSRFIVNLAIITTLLTVAGFFVVHSYLATITSLFTYKIDPIIYVASGINLVYGTLLALVDVIVFLIIFLFGCAILGFVIGIIKYWKRIFGPDKNKYEPLSFSERVKRFRSNLKSLFIQAMIILLSFTLAYSPFYGQNAYKNSPRYLGGGQLADVILIFQQPDKLATMGLPIQMNPTYPAQSQPVELLMELSDGVLVRDPQTQIPVIIKNELIYGMIDAAPPTPAATTTP